MIPTATAVRTVIVSPKNTRPKTAEPELWAVRHTPEPKIWPRTLVTGESPEPVLAAPSPASFGIEKFGPVIKVAMAQTFERKVISDGVSPVGGVWLHTRYATGRRSEIDRQHEWPRVGRGRSTTRADGAGPGTSRVGRKSENGKKGNRHVHR